MSTIHDRTTTAKPDLVPASAPPLVRGEVASTDLAGHSAGGSPMPILVTEQQVLFSTSAAVPLQRTTKTAHWWADASRVVTAARRIFVIPTADARPARKYHPARYGYLEHALMARELDRL